MKRLISVVLAVGILAWILGLGSDGGRRLAGPDPDRSIHER